MQNGQVTVFASLKFAWMVTTERGQLYLVRLVC